MPSANVPPLVAPYVSQTGTGVQYLNTAALQGTPTQKATIIKQATSAGIKVISNANEGADLTNIQNAYANLSTMAGTFSNLASPTPLSRFFNNHGINQAATYFQTDAQKTAAGALNDASLDLLKAISGTQGFRGNQAAIEQIKSSLPTIYDTTDVAAAKLANVKQLIQNRENAILGIKGAATTPQPATQPSTQPATTASGKPFDYAAAKNAGYTDDEIRKYLASN